MRLRSWASWWGCTESCARQGRQRGGSTTTLTYTDGVLAMRETDFEGDGQIDLREQLHIADGRRFIASADAGAYDVITLEPPPPRAAGVAALYSVEFYSGAKRLLRDGGALAQWLPMHGMTYPELAMLTRTFLQVFPAGRLIRIKDNEAALVAGGSEHLIAARAAQPAVAQHLSEIGAPDPAALPRRSGAALIARIGPGPVVTDDHPRVEHFAAGLSWQAGDDVSERWRFVSMIFGPATPP